MAAHPNNVPNETLKICAQEGPQTTFLETKADIAIYGGSAGSGKSYALLLEPLRNFNNSNFKTVIFRRTSVQVRNAGGMWDQSFDLYFPTGAKPREAYLEWEFPSGATVKFSHLETEKDIYSWQGSQITLICFDELIHFTESQFFYLLSRNRSSAGVPGYIRATCNPDSDSWLRKILDWWIGEDGYPIKERSGIIRWFIRQDDLIIWADSREELIQRYGSDQLPKSFTFIAANIYDNKILMNKDPSYLSNLMALSRVERLRLLGGNWNVRATGGSIFRREWFTVVDAVPAGWIRMCRYWDRASTKPNESNKNPDWTRGLKFYKYPDGSFCVVDLKSCRDTPGQVENLVKNVASQDSVSCMIVGEQDPGSAGVADATRFVSMLAGYNVRMRRNTKDKVTRSKPVSAQAEVGNIRVLRAPWNDDFFQELENFPDPSSHDDIVDCLSGAFNELIGGVSLCDVL